MGDTYFIVGKFVFPGPMTVDSATDYFQEVVYDKGGAAGFFKVVEVVGNEVRVRFERSHSEDDVYGKENNPLDLSEGLRIQLGAELKDSFGCDVVGEKIVFELGSVE